MVRTLANFTIREKKPTKKDKYAKCYIRKANGGWSGAIQGKPTDSECNVLSNCVGYAQGRFCEIYNEITGYEGVNKYQYLNCDAENFGTRATKTYPSLKQGKEPKPGAICVMAGKGDLAGHVMIVEKVIDKNTIYTSESSYNGKAFYNKTRSNSNGR